MYLQNKYNQAFEKHYPIFSSLFHLNANAHKWIIFPYKIFSQYYTTFVIWGFRPLPVCLILSAPFPVGRWSELGAHASKSTAVHVKDF